MINVDKTKSAELNKALKDLMISYTGLYNSLRQKSEDEAKKALQPGQIFHAKTGFYDDINEATFKSHASKLKGAAHDLIDKISLEVMAENTKAPSPEAVNVAILINARQNVSAEELDQLMTRYGRDCPMVYKSLHEKAEALGYHDFKPHPITEAAEQIEALNRVIDRAFEYDPGRSMTAAAAAYDMTIDEVFTIEE